MPKKFKGENSKATAAKERKAAAREAAEQEKRQKEEDEYWRDDHRLTTRKQERKEDKEKKKQEQVQRKQTAKLLLEEEEAKIGGKTKAPEPKVTRAQIQARQEQRRKEESEGATALPKGVVVGPDLMENPNHLLRDRLERGEVEARTVEEAIDVLRVSSQDKTDKHPEKRMKAAYAAFEERELPRLKQENPNLRQSQVKQLLRKEWLKSPENPLNHL